MLPASGTTVNSFSQTGGSLTLNSGVFTTMKSVLMTDVTLNDNGGSFQPTGNLATLDNGTLNDGPNASPGLILEGVCTLNGPIGSSGYLDISVASGSNLSSTYVTVASGFVNKGTILIGATGPTGNPLPVTMTVAGGSTFTNDGTIYAGVETTLVGKISNYGNIGESYGLTTLSEGSSIVNQPGGMMVFGYALESSTFDDSQPGASIVNEPGGTIIAGGQQSYALPGQHRDFAGVVRQRGDPRHRLQHRRVPVPVDRRRGLHPDVYRDTGCHPERDHLGRRV